VSAQTDAIAVDIMEDLEDQKASLLRTRGKVLLSWIEVTTLRVLGILISVDWL